MHGYFSVISILELLGESERRFPLMKVDRGHFKTKSSRKFGARSSASIVNSRLRPRLRDRRITAGPVVAAPREQPDRVAVAADLQAIAVAFDLVHPVGP